MDMIFIVETGVACYRYSPNLRARAILLEDKRLHKELCTPEEWERLEEESYEQYPYNWEIGILHEWLEKEPEKTLVIMDFDIGAAENMLPVYQKEAAKRGDRVAVFHFCHNDESMQDLWYAQTTVEELIEDKVSWLACLTKYPFIKSVEIPYNFTITQKYLEDLFSEYFAG
jgi:hypothetical protein